MPRAPLASIAPLLVLFALVALFASAAACGDDDAGNHNDGGQPGVHRLVILNPPGRSIGLAPGESSLLRVQYLDPQDRPVEDAQVGFAIQGSAAGATLAGFSSYTDDTGTAKMLLTASGAPASFTVSVTASQSLPALFEVAVSEAGFAHVEVEPAYLGSHSLSDVAGLRAELRFDTSCVDVSPLGELAPDRQRSLGGFSDMALFENLPVDRPYAIALRVLGEEDRTLAWGCTDLYAGQLVRGATMRLHLLAQDLSTSAAGRYTALTSLELPAGSHAALRSYFTAYLPTGGCPHGVEQLLLDCLLDAAFPDGAADCVVQSTDPAAADLEALRGEPDVQGCRDTQTALGQPSLELELHQSADATGLLRLEALAALAALADDSLETLTLMSLRSEIQVLEIPEAGTAYSWHQLQQVSFPGISAERWLHLSDLGAAPLSVASLPTTCSVGPPPLLTIPPHGLSLQPGWAAFHAAWLEHLQPLGVPRDPRLALPLLVQGFQGPASAPLAQGCEAVTARLCEALGQPPDCLPDLCDEGLVLLTSLVGAAWDALPSPLGPDAMFTTSAVLYDEDGDLQADRLGTPTVPADWLLTLRFGDQWIAPASATFDATRLASP